MLDAPVSGRPPTMTVMVGGDEAVFARYRPLLAAMAGNIFYVGGAGAGCAAKLVTQYLGYTNFVAALEGMLIGAKAGIDLGVLAQIVPVSAGASRTFDNIPRSVLPGSFTAGGTLDIVAKDLHARLRSGARSRGAGASRASSRMTCCTVRRRKAGGSRVSRSPRGSSRRWPGPNCAPPVGDVAGLPNDRPETARKGT